MFCPDCNHSLSPVIVPSKNGQIILDYCSQCGGVWTDHAETNFFESRDLNAIKSILPHQSLKNLKGSALCPHDRTPLTLLQHESVPPGVRVVHCEKCGGNWFPHHQLEKFKHAQKAKLRYFKLFQIPLPSIYAVLLPLLIITVLSVGMIGAIIGIRYGQDSTIKAKDIISKPSVVNISSNEVVIVFSTQQPTITSLSYWIDTLSRQTLIVSTEPKTQHMVRILELRPKTTYSYQITVQLPGGTQYSSVYSFTTE